jgi:hypothetical protein
MDMGFFKMKPKIPHITMTTLLRYSETLLTNNLKGASSSPFENQTQKRERPSQSRLDL